MDVGYSLREYKHGLRPPGRLASQPKARLRREAGSLRGPRLGFAAAGGRFAALLVGLASRVDGPVVRWVRVRWG
ncbi:hypothetical protein GCM10027271_28750 [Saccharopolyspora gloriosae]